MAPPEINACRRLEAIVDTEADDAERARSFVDELKAQCGHLLEFPQGPRAARAGAEPPLHYRTDAMSSSTRQVRTRC